MMPVGVVASAGKRIGSASSYDSAVLDKGAIAYWPLRDDLKDLAGAHDLTVDAGGPATFSADAVLGSALNGQSAALRTGVTIPTAGYTMEAWVRASGSSAQGVMIGDWAGESLGGMLAAFGSEYRAYKEVSFIAVPSLGVGVLAHVVNTWASSGEWNVYVNGVLAHAPGLHTSFAAPPSNVGYHGDLIGGYSRNTSETFRYVGALGRVAWYSRALSAVEVADNYAVGTA